MDALSSNVGLRKSETKADKKADSSEIITKSAFSSLISFVQENSSKLEHLFSQKFKCKKGRVLTYYEQQDTLQRISDSALPILVSTGTGAVIGGSVGFGIGALGGPKGMGIGLATGAGIGGIIGLGTGVAIAIKNTRTHYMEWLKKYRQLETHSLYQEFFPQFLTLFLQHPIRRIFICPITLCPINEPVTDGYTIYERSEIELWLQNRSTSPINNLPLKIEDLKPAYGMMLTQLKEYRKILDEEHDDAEFNRLLPYQREGFLALTLDLERTMISLFLKELALLKKLKNEEKLSKEFIVSNIKPLSEGIGIILEKPFEQTLSVIPKEFPLLDSELTYITTIFSQIQSSHPPVIEKETKPDVIESPET